jgi:hypothetical protein
MKDFFLRHGVKQVAMTEGNMGCPHEEGEDFPQGEDCPFCPFWKGKQRSRRWEGEYAVPSTEVHPQSARLAFDHALAGVDVQTVPG